MRIRPPAFAVAPTPRAAHTSATTPLDPVQRDTLRAYAALEPWEPDDASIVGSRRADGWTCDRQRTFLAALAEGATVDAAAKLVGLSTSSAYAFRQRAHGAAFALGWHAALLLQRQKLADTLTARAFDGQVDTYTRADGTQVTRHRHDNRLGLALLTRLDRVAAAGEAEDRHGEAQAARIVAGEWQAYLDLVAADAAPARAGLFLAARAAAAPPDAAGEGADPVAALAPVLSLARADLYLRTGQGDAAAVPIHDCDPAARADWTADQWRRAEAAGLVALAPPEPVHNPPLPQHSDAAAEAADGEDDEDRVWYDEAFGDWMTDFPAPLGHYPHEEGSHEDGTWRRSLTAAESYAVEQARGDRDAEAAADTEDTQAARRAWFAARQPRFDPDAPQGADWFADTAPVSAAEPESIVIVGPADPPPPVARLERPAGQHQPAGEQGGEDEERPLARIGEEDQRQRRDHGDAIGQVRPGDAVPGGRVHRLERRDERQCPRARDQCDHRRDADLGQHQEEGADDQ